MDQIPCPDGYILDAKSPLAEGHHALNHYLVRVEDAGWQIALKEINAIRDKSRKLAAWKALLERFAWLRDNQRASPCVSPFRGLAERIEKWTLAPTEADLIDLLKRTASVADFAAPHTPMPHLLEHIRKQGLTPQLSAAIREFRDAVYESGYRVNQVSLQLFRSRLDMLAWRDEWSPIDLKRCWSERIRAEFREMPSQARESWRRLLHSVDGDEGTNPNLRWLEEMKGVAASIGTTEFDSVLLRWLSPLTRGSEHKLSREGSYLLRSFLWIAQLRDTPAMKSKLEEIRDVAFKPKNNGEKVLRVASEAVGQPAPSGRPPAIAPSFEYLIGRAMEAALSPVNSLIPPGISQRIQFSGPVVYVQGELDRYQIHLSTSEAWRESDGRRVRVADKSPVINLETLPAFGGIANLLRAILTLADDKKHAPYLSLEESLDETPGKP